MKRRFFQFAVGCGSTGRGYLRGPGTAAFRLGRGCLRAFTLVEMLLALMISGLVMSAVVTMLTAVSYGTTSRMDSRSLLVRSKTLEARLGSAVRSCQEVRTSEMAAGSPYLILWVADTNQNGTPDNAEMRLIDFVSATGRINHHYNPAAAGAYANVTSFRSAVASEEWAGGVSACTFDANSSGANVLVSRRITLTHGDVSLTSVGADATRN